MLREFEFQVEWKFNEYENDQIYDDPFLLERTNVCLRTPYESFSLEISLFFEVHGCELSFSEKYMKKSRYEQMKMIPRDSLDVCNLP